MSEPNEEAGPADEGEESLRPKRRKRDPPASKQRPSHKVAELLGHTPALAKIGAAAKAVGLSTEELVDLVADSGAMALPPADELTEQITLSELGVHLRTQLGQLAKPDRPIWFQHLGSVQQGAVVVSLRTHGASTHAVAAEFRIPAIEVQEVYAEHVDKIGQNVTHVRLTTIVGQMQVVAERAQHGAMEKKDWGTYWRIQKDLIANLQSLGIVDKAIQRIEVTHKLADRERENIDRLADLRMKQRDRREEIKLVSAEVTDAVPEEFATFWT